MNGPASAWSRRIHCRVGSSENPKRRIASAHRPVMPAKAGTHAHRWRSLACVNPRLREDDGKAVNCLHRTAARDRARRPIVGSVRPRRHGPFKVRKGAVKRHHRAMKAGHPQLMRARQRPRVQHPPAERRTQRLQQRSSQLLQAAQLRMACESRSTQRVGETFRAGIAQFDAGDANHAA